MSDKIIKYIILNTLLFIGSFTILYSLPDKGIEDKASYHKLKGSEKEKINLTLLISDGGHYAQIIQCTDSTVKHGFAEVYPYEELYDSDIVWDPNFEIDGIVYPTVERKLTHLEKETLTSIIHLLQYNSFEDPYVIYDDYKYILYINNKKEASAFMGSLKLEKFPSKFKEILLNILSLETPLYPNYGIP